MKRGWFRYLGVGVVAIALTIGACSSKEHMDDPILALDYRPYVAKPADDSINRVELRVAYFDTDRAELTAPAKEALRENAEWMKKNPTAYLQIEGLCDDRGSNEYNLKLGERRSEAAKQYLESLGIEGERLTIMSYGRVPGLDDAKVRRENRKVTFLVYYPK